MATVIKAVGPIRVSNGMSFNFDDMTERANSHLDDVRIHAADIIARARQEGEAIRRNAETEGKQAAIRAAEKMMDEKVGKQLDTLLPAIQRAAVELEKARQAWLSHWERTAVHLATRIAERIVRREIAREPRITVTLVREALELAAGNDEITVRINPADLEALGTHLESLCKELGGKSKATIVSDEALSAGGCRVETRFGTIDQRIEEQLKRIEEELV
jgi:flagellar biosynthesis/type III secretory pathway protein FliH